MDTKEKIFCDYCIHKYVCQYKPQMKEVVVQVRTRWNNICTADIFDYEVRCKEFQSDANYRPPFGNFRKGEQ